MYQLHMLNKFWGFKQTTFLNRRHTGLQITVQHDVSELFTVTYKHGDYIPTNIGINLFFRKQMFLPLFMLLVTRAQETI